MKIDPPIDWDRIFPDPSYPSDDAKVARWRGYLKFDPLWIGGTLLRPTSVTFPICDQCGRVVWDWPHFEEKVEEGSVCEDCFNAGNEENW